MELLADLAPLVEVLEAGGDMSSELVTTMSSSLASLNELSDSFDKDLPIENLTLDFSSFFVDDLVLLLIILVVAFVV